MELQMKLCCVIKMCSKCNHENECNNTYSKIYKLTSEDLIMLKNQIEVQTTL